MGFSPTQRWTIGRYALITVALGAAGIASSFYTHDETQKPLLGASIAIEVISAALAAYGFEAERWPRKLYSLLFAPCISDNSHVALMETPYEQFLRKI